MFESTRPFPFLVVRFNSILAGAFALGLLCGCGVAVDSPETTAAPASKSPRATQAKAPVVAAMDDDSQPTNNDSPIDVPLASDESPTTLAPDTATKEARKADDPADLEALKKLKFEYDTNGDDQVIEVNFKKSKATESNLKLISRFASLEILNLDKTGVTDAGLAHLKGLKHLRELSLEENSITDAGLVHLAGLKKLEVLSLVKTKITGAGLKHLRGLREITVLNLSHCKVDDTGLEHLTAYPKMETLALQDTKVNGSGFIHLAKLKNLITLNLDDVNIKGNAMLNFKDLPKIRIIYMRNSTVPKKSLKKLRDAAPSLAVFD